LMVSFLSLQFEFGEVLPRTSESRPVPSKAVHIPILEFKLIKIELN
jgi:hypothetical protein